MIAGLAALFDALRVLVWLLVAAVIGYAQMVAMSRHQKLQHGGVRITSKHQPALMSAVDDVMRWAGIRRLDGVWLEPGANASAISGHRDWLGRRHVGVTIGFLTAAHLTAEELTAILAHEAGHLIDPHRIRYLLGRRRRQALTKLERRSARPMWWFWRAFLALTRDQGVAIERDADAMSAQMCGDQIASRAMHRVAEAGVVHAITMRNFVEPLWEQRLTPATLLEAYERIWTQLPAAIAANVDARMNAPELPRDTHPGLAERTKGQGFPLRPQLRGDLQLVGLAELDRRCTAKLTQLGRRYPMRALSWSELQAGFSVTGAAG